jgi:hypothetical protein
MLVVTTGWALFNDKETVALAALAVGFLLTYLAYTGQVLSSFKGPAGLEGAFAELSNTVKTVLDDPDVPDAVKTRITDGMDVESPQMPGEVVEAAKRVKTARQQAMDYEAKVRAALRSVAPNAGWTLQEDLDLPFDVFLRLAQGDEVAIEIKWSQNQATTSQIARWARELDAVSRGGLVITNSALVGPYSERCVQWVPDAPAKDLEAALRDALDKGCNEREPRHD